MANSRNGRIFELILWDKTFFHFKFDKGFIKLALAPLSGFFQVAFHQIGINIFHTVLNYRDRMNSFSFTFIMVHFFLRKFFKKEKMTKSRSNLLVPSYSKIQDQLYHICLSLTLLIPATPTSQSVIYLWVLYATNYLLFFSFSG